MMSSLMLASPWGRLAILSVAVASAAPARTRAPEKTEAEVTASTSTVWLVETFLKMPTAKLPPEAVPEFLRVDAGTLPKKLRDPYKAKKKELFALKSISDGKFKPPRRLAGKEPANTCAEPERMGAQGIGMLKQLGFVEVEEDDEEWLMRESKCTECELQTEFTLTIIEEEPRKKGARPRRRYFFKDADPILVLLGHRKAGTKMGGTNFFGIGGGPKCR